ncbi:MAG: hypothetical protein AAF198_11135 [Pseudomonadota bacterium]
MTDLVMPAARAYGWELKPDSSSHFEIDQKDNGQFCVVLNHALLRGVSAEMLRWWFRNFTVLKVRLEGVPNYDGKVVPAYLLWHPSDHVNATLSGKRAADGTAQAGCKIHIQEAMQYDTYGWKYPVDAELAVAYVGPDGWAMGKFIPFLGPVMMLRIHFKDVIENGKHIGAHYHYEVVIGVRGNNPISKSINKKIGGEYGPEFFAAWQRHNVIEVGVFENFLPPLFAQKKDLSSLTYSPDMNPDLPSPNDQTGFSQELFDTRVKAYAEGTNASAVQRYDQKTFL